MNKLRGPIAPIRLAIIKQAFDKLDADLNGKITLEEIAKVYNAKKHPQVIKGYKTEKEIFMEFVGMWDQNGDAIITLDEFNEYYKVSNIPLSLY